MIKKFSITATAVLAVLVMMPFLTYVFEISVYQPTGHKLNCDHPQLMCSFAKCWEFCPFPPPTKYSGILCATQLDHSYLNEQWKYSCPVDYGPYALKTENNLNHDDRDIPSLALEQMRERP